jgi:hypothetical protein
LFFGLAAKGSTVFIFVYLLDGLSVKPYLAGASSFFSSSFGAGLRTGFGTVATPAT